MSQDRVTDALREINLAINTIGRYIDLVSTTNIHTGKEEIRVFQENHICSDNTTSVLLGANETFTGNWQDTLNYQEIALSIVASHNSASNGLVFQWSADGVNVGDTDVFSYYASSGGTNYTPNPAFRYFRVVYTNGSTPQTSFNILTILRRGVTGGSFHRIDSTLKDDQDGRLVVSVPKLKTASNTWVSQQATSSGNAKVSLEELESGVSTYNKTQLRTSIHDATSGLSPTVEARKNTPTGNALNVQIGPGDPISNIPVVMEFEHHQIHEGETHVCQNVNTGLNTSTYKFSIVVPANIYPHFVCLAQVYNGNCRVDVYEGATYTGGAKLTAWNKNRNSLIVPGTNIYAGVTSTNGTLMPCSFFAGQGTKAVGDSRASSEWILKPSTTYRVDLTGILAGTDVIFQFQFYEDLGV